MSDGAYKNSRIPGFHRRPIKERLEAMGKYLALSFEQIDGLRKLGELSDVSAEDNIENVVGVYGLPIGVGVNLRVNDKDRLIPMVTEEASIVAGVSKAAKAARAGGGFWADADPPVMIGQVQVQVEDCAQAAKVLGENEEALIAHAESSPLLQRLKARGIRVTSVRTSLLHEQRGRNEGRGGWLVLHLHLFCGEAMGASLVNEACENLKEPVEKMTGGRVALCILSNLTDTRCARAWVRIPTEALAEPKYGLSGDEVARRIAEATFLAQIDPYRAATHNKGIMNGVDAVALATGNDWRALEAGAHAFASRGGYHHSLSDWRVRGSVLHGTVTLPMAVGVVGRVLYHPMAALMLKLLRTDSALDLARVMAAVGLAQNLAALTALTAGGIQAGHRRLHVRGSAKKGATILDIVNAIVNSAQYRKENGVPDP